MTINTFRHSSKVRSTHPMAGGTERKSYQPSSKIEESDSAPYHPRIFTDGRRGMDLHSARFDAINHNKKPYSPKDLQAKVHNLIWSEISQHHS